MTIASPTPWRQVLLLFAIGFLAFTIYYVILKRSQPNFWSDSYEYAQVGRNVAQGRGLVTNAASVLELYLLDKGSLPLPYFLHDVGNSLLIASFFKLFGASEAVLGWASGTFYILLVPLTFLLGSKIFNRQVGAIAALLALVNTQLVTFGVTGLSELPYAFFLTLLLYAVYSQRDWWHFVVSGALFGVAVILRSNSLPFLPWLIVFVAVAQDEWSRAKFRAALKSGAIRIGLFLSGFLLLFAPDAWRNYVWLHNPLYNVNSLYALVWYTSAIPGKSTGVIYETGLSINPVQFVLTHPEEILNKVWYELSHVILQLFMGGPTFNYDWTDAVVIFVFLFSIFAPPARESERQRYFRWMVYACIATAFVVGALFNLRWRHLYGFIPIVLIYVAELIQQGFQTSAWGQQMDASGSRWAPHSIFPIAAIVGMLALLGIGPIIAGIPPTNDVYFHDLGAFVEKQTPESAVILTNTTRSHYLAWFSTRQFVSYADYTLQTLTAHAAEGPLFLLIAADSPDLNKSVSDVPPASGFTPLARLKNGRGVVTSVLFGRQ
jgi:hypothetical protein